MPDKIETPGDVTAVLEQLHTWCRVQKCAGVRFFYPDAAASAPLPEKASDEAAPHHVPAGDAGDAAMGLRKVREEIGECTRCGLCAGRTQIVFGTGNPAARLMFIGEAPGADEDRQGEPFVGRAGQLLTRIIQAIGMAREDVYIANIVKCRPPGNRDPQDDEIRTCIPFLKQQIDIIDPRVICTLGRIAAHALLGTDTGITRLRGRFHAYGNSMVMPTYHPSYLLRAPEKKKETWIDMQMVQKLLAGSE